MPTARDQGRQAVEKIALRLGTGRASDYWGLGEQAANKHLTEPASRSASIQISNRQQDPKDRAMTPPPTTGALPFMPGAPRSRTSCAEG